MSAFVLVADVSSECFRYFGKTVKNPKLEILLISTSFRYTHSLCLQLTRAVNTDAHGTEPGNHTYIYSFILSQWPALFTVALHSSRCFCWQELDVVIRGPLQTRTFLDSHLPLSSKPSCHPRFLECERLVYVINDSFTITEAQQTAPSTNYHPTKLSFIL